MPSCAALDEASLSSVWGLKCLYTCLAIHLVKAAQIDDVEFSVLQYID